MKQNRALKKRSPRGQMRPLSPSQVATIGSTLSDRKDLRSLALFRVAIDSMLRASDLVRLTIPEMVGQNGVVLDTITTRQKKTDGGITAALSMETRDAVARWLGARPETWEDWLFPGKDAKGHLSESQYRRDAKEWFALAHLDTRFYSTHSLRRTKAALVYSKTGNIEVVRRLLGHKSVEATSKYLGIEDADAIRIAREIKI